MYITGLLIGIFSFVIIGVFHPIVIRCEYHFTWKIWPVFLAAGLICLLISLFVENGWFPANPKRAPTANSRRDGKDA